MRLACLSTLALVAAFAVVSSPAAGLGDDSNWIQTRFYPFGADTEVWSCIEYNGDLVVSGNFATVDDVIAPGVARWDGTRWHGYPGVERGGLLTELNGQLTVFQAWPAPGAPEYTLFQVQTWNGTTWDASPVIFQFTGVASGGMIEVANRVAGSAEVWNGVLLVTPAHQGTATYFTLDGGSVLATIGQWNGTQWSAFTTPELVEYVDLGVWCGTLFASGYSFSSSGFFVDLWEGAAWTGVWSGAVTDFGVHDGEFFAAAEDDGVLMWNGEAWCTYAGATSAFEISGSSSGLAVNAGTEVQAWDGSAWQVLAGLEGPVHELLETPDGLVATGNFDGKIAIHDGATWDTPGTGNGLAFDGEVHALLPYQGDLYVAGSFVFPGSTDRTQVAAWNGTDWREIQSASPFHSAQVRAMTVYDGELILGEGDGFSTQHSITAWGTSMRTVGTAQGGVEALVVYDGNLIAGGTFLEIDGVPAIRLAAWDGTTWSGLGDIQNGVVHSIAVWNGKLIVAGDFTGINGYPISNLASWDGSQWDDFEPGGPQVVTGPVVALAVHDGNLVAAGDFWNGAEFIASWDDTDWTTLGGGLDAAPQAMYSMDAWLFVSGNNLSEAGGVPVNRIAVWDGSVWHALGNGLEHPRADETPLNRRKKSYSRGWAFATYQDLLYVGGNFRTAGGSPSNHLASWNPPQVLADPSEDTTVQALAVKAGFPNPCRTSTHIPLSLPVAGRVVAEVFDIAGRNLGTILDRELPAGDNAVVWNPRTMTTRAGTAISAGAYFIRVSAGGETRSQKVVYIP